MAMSCPDVRVDLDVAARQRRIGRHGLAVGELRGLGRLEHGPTASPRARRRRAAAGGPARRCPSAAAASSSSNVRMPCSANGLHRQAAQGGHVAHRPGSARDVLDERPDVGAFRAANVQRRARASRSARRVSSSITTRRGRARPRRPSGPAGTAARRRASAPSTSAEPGRSRRRTGSTAAAMTAGSGAGSCDRSSVDLAFGVARRRRRAEPRRDAIGLASLEHEARRAAWRRRKRSAACRSRADRGCRRGRPSRRRTGAWRVAARDSTTCPAGLSSSSSPNTSRLGGRASGTVRASVGVVARAARVVDELAELDGALGARVVAKAQLGNAPQLQRAAPRASGRSRAPARSLP